jgi:hypothetical protein
MSSAGPRQKRRIEQLASSIVTRRDQSALAVALLAGGGGYLYIRNVQQQAADRRKKLRAALRSATASCLVKCHPRNCLRQRNVKLKDTSLDPSTSVCRQDAKGGNGNSADADASKALVSRKKPPRGVALQQLLKLLLSIAGPKILALVGLALARTALSNRLARLQVQRLPEKFSGSERRDSSISSLSCVTEVQESQCEPDYAGCYVGSPLQDSICEEYPSISARYWRECAAVPGGIGH